MRIVHVSFAKISEYKDAKQWLRKIDYFTGIVKDMSKVHSVTSIHHISYNGTCKDEGADFVFIKPGTWQNVLFIKTIRYISKREPDVVIIHSFSFLLPIFLLRLVLGRTAKYFIQNHAEKPSRWLLRRVAQRYVDSFLTGYFFTSADQAVDWIDNKIIRNITKVHEVMEASSPFHYGDKVSARVRTKVKGSRTYLWIGRLDDNKDPITLISAFVEFSKMYSDVNLYLIYQQDSLLKQCEAIAEKCPNINFMGYRNHDELEDWFNGADFILSTSHHEGSGIAVCEGMSCGCIPIVTDIPSFRMMTANGKYGLLFPPGDDKQLLKRLHESYHLDIEVHRRKVLMRFNEELSFSAISKKMLAAIEQHSTI